MLEFLASNWPLKLLALALAFGIWVAVTGEQAIVRDFDAPLDIRLPDNMTFANDPPASVTVRLRGQEMAIRRLGQYDVTASAQLPPGLLGERELSLGAENLTGVPRGVDLEYISPSRVAVVVDRKVRKRLPVEATIAGKPPEGYSYYGAEVRPDTLTVEGPEREVNAMERLRTNPVRLDELTQPSNFVAVTVPDMPHVQVVDPRQLVIRVIVDATPDDRVFKGVAVVPTGQLFRTEITPKQVDVTLSAPPALLDRITPAALLAVVDITGLEPRERPYLVPLDVDYRNIPLEDQPRIALKNITAEEAEVRIFVERLQP